ncbi:MAG: hypothetical protein RIR26_2996, partial [Pseudomonadota bacterium]
MPTSDAIVSTHTSNTNVLNRYLSNGCEAYLERVDFAPLVTLQLWVKTGSLDEAPEEFGMAHVLEHMLFKGTEKFPRTGDVARQVELAGGEINAYTTFDHTVFYINAPREFAFQGTELLFDVVCSSLLDSEELSRELEVVIEEIRRGRDNPSARVSKALFARIFEGHPKARPVIGYEEVVKTFNRESLRAFYKRWYIPNNMFFVAAGDFHLGEMNAKLDQLAQEFLPNSLPQRHWSKTHAWPQHSSPVCEVIHGPYQETRLQLTVPAPRLEDDATAAWEMYASILGHGDSSRLSHAVKDEAQLVTAIEASLYTPRFPFGFSGFGFYARSETAREAVLAGIGEIARLAKEGPSHSELQRVLTSAKADKIYSRESVEGLVRSVGNNLLTTARLEFDTLFLQKLSRVTTEQVQACAQQVCESLLSGRAICVAAANQEHESIINLGTLQETLSEGANVIRQILGNRDTQDTPVSRIRSRVHQVSERNPAIRQESVALSDLAKLNFNTRPSTRLPVSSHVLVWRWGQHEEPESKIGLNAFLAQMLTRGTTRQSYRSFVTELEELGASVSAFSGRDLFGLRLDALSEVQPRALHMLVDCLVRPAFSAEQFERVMRETEEVLIAQKDSPGSRLGRLNGALLYGAHPYSRPSLGSLDTLHNITLDDVVTQWSRFRRVNTFVLSGAGQFNTHETLETVAVELSALLSGEQTEESAGAPLRTADAAPQMPRTARVGFDRLEREQAHISLSVRGYTLSEQKRTALEVACGVLGGQGGRLFMDLRDAQSLAYSVGCSQAPSLWGGSFNSYIATASGKAQQAVAGLKSHLERIATEPPAAEELLRAKNSLLGGQSLDSQHHHYQASQLAMSDIYGLGFDNFLGFKERIEAVTPKDVSESVHELLKKEGACLAIVGP